VALEVRRIELSRVALSPVQYRFMTPGSVARKHVVPHLVIFPTLSLYIPVAKAHSARYELVGDDSFCDLTPLSVEVYIAMPSTLEHLY